MDIDESTNAVTAPDTTYLTEEYAAQVAAKVTDLRQRIADVLADGERLDADLARAITSAAGSPRLVTKTASSIGDLLLPTTVGQREPASAPRDLNGALDQLAGGPVPANPRGPVPLDPAKVEQFKALTRQMLQREGVPPDQIEQRLDAAVAAAQRPPSPRTPPKADRMPPPGFGDGFADRWFSTEEGFKDLLGQNGLDAFKDSWKGLAKGTGERLTNPVGSVIGDAQDALDSPSAAYYLGEKSADAAVTAPGLMLGGEAALARAGLVDDLAGAGAIPRELIDHPGHAVEHPAAHSQLPEPSSPVGDIPSHQDIPASTVDLQPGPLPHDSPMFDGYDPMPPGPEFANPDGGLIYPDDGLTNKPYAVPGTVIDNAEVPQGTIMDRFGHPGGAWLSPDGTPFAERALPPDSANKTYYQYVVGDPANIPHGYRIEESQVAPWFHQPGGGTQFESLDPTEGMHLCKISSIPSI